jgi:hypothetical protein
MTEPVEVETRFYAEGRANHRTVDAATALTEIARAMSGSARVQSNTVDYDGYRVDLEIELSQLEPPVHTFYRWSVSSAERK